MTANDVIKFTYTAVREDLSYAQVEEWLHTNFSEWTADCLWMDVRLFIERAKILKTFEEEGWSTNLLRYTVESICEVLKTNIPRTLEYTKGKQAGWVCRHPNIRQKPTSFHSLSNTAWEILCPPLIGCSPQFAYCIIYM